MLFLNRVTSLYFSLSCCLSAGGDSYATNWQGKYLTSSRHPSYYFHLSCLLLSQSAGQWALLKDHLGIDKHSWEYELLLLKARPSVGELSKSRECWLQCNKQPARLQVWSCGSNQQHTGVSICQTLHYHFTVLPSVIFKSSDLFFFFPCFFWLLALGTQWDIADLVTQSSKKHVNKLKLISGHRDLLAWFVTCDPFVIKWYSLQPNCDVIKMLFKMQSECF